MKKEYNNIIKGVKKYFKDNKLKKAVIGLSGGIDSSLCARLVADAIGPENLHGLILPDIDITSLKSVSYAKYMARSIGIKYSIIPINRFIGQFRKLPWKESHIAVINTKSRIRANILFNYANTHNALVIGTSNKSELALGYFTKYGDGAADIEVIGSLYKTEVFELSRFLKLPEMIIRREPTAELFHGHTDEKELGAPYSQLDTLLRQIAAGKRPKGVLAGKLIKRIKDNEHKRKAIPIIRAR